MDTGNSEKKSNSTIADLYPALDETQLKEAEDNLNRYLELVLRIYNRLEEEKKSMAGGL